MLSLFALVLLQIMAAPTLDIHIKTEETAALAKPAADANANATANANANAASANADAAFSFPRFADLNFAANWIAKQVHQNKSGKGKSVYLDGLTREGGKTGIVHFVLCEDMIVSFPPRPAGGEDSGESNRCNIELSFPDTPAGISSQEACRRFDAWFLDCAVAAHTSGNIKDAWFPDLLPMFQGQTRETVRLMLSTKIAPFMKPGGISSKDKPYGPSTRFKFDGWNPFIQELLFETAKIKGVEKAVVRGCTWRCDSRCRRR